ncbi:MAG: type I-B CRISPR-associated protein Cas8b1/Cst1 [Caldimicrobium sp.]
MGEKVYLWDWLYNAGIVGFIRIFEYSGRKNQITFGDNYIEFDPQVLRDFHERYFNFAYEKIDLYKIINEPNIEDLSKSVKDLRKKYKELKEDKNIERALKVSSQNLREELIRHWEVRKDLYAKKYYLWNFYSGKSFLNSAVKEKIKDIFYDDFIKPIIEPIQSTSSRRGAITCKICNIRPAKKGAFFDEGAFKLSGASVNEYKNFYWNLIPNTHLCSICELIYLCSFAGFSNLKSIGEWMRYIFVNLDARVIDLYEINRTLEGFILNKENPYKEVIRDVVLRFQQRRSSWSIENILFVEFDTREGASKIQHFHIPRYIAKLFTGDEYESFNSLKGFIYEKKDGTSVNVLKRLIDHILEGVSLYGFLNEILKDMILGLHQSSNRLFEIVKIQSSLNLYKLRREDMKASVYDKIESAYKEGWHLSKALVEAGSQNKIDSIAFKLLSALRVKDIGAFYDTLLRLYIGLERSIPKYFIDAFSSDSPVDIEALGYSFLTGLLSGRYAKNIKGGENYE